MTRSFSSWIRSLSIRSCAYGTIFSCELVEARPGFAILRIHGCRAKKLFRQESGGHRWQRIPPTERRGRYHTSTVTVAVLSEPTERELHIDQRDLEWKTCRGSGAGGQHRNKTDSAVQLRYKPSGLSVRVESERSQTKNKVSALALL